MVKVSKDLRLFAACEGKDTDFLAFLNYFQNVPYAPLLPYNLQLRLSQTER